jgi:uncharacterized Tic20 family protein
MEEPMLHKDQDPVDQYPTLMSLLRYRLTAILVGTILPVLLGAWATLKAGDASWIVLGLIGGGLAYVMLRVALELLELVTDLLVPR